MLLLYILQAKFSQPLSSSLTSLVFQASRTTAFSHENSHHLSVRPTPLLRRSVLAAAACHLPRHHGIDTVADQLLLQCPSS